MLTGLDPHALNRGLAALGLPPPVALRPLGRPVLNGTYELEFPATARVRSLVMRVVMADPGWGGVGAERAALRVAHLLSELPVPAEYAILDPGLQGPAISVASKLPGLKGTEFLRRGGPASEEAARQVGVVLGALEGCFQGSFGTRATLDGEFLPRRASWREELGALVEGWVAAARGAGTWLGPLADRLHDQVRVDLHALDEVYQWGLVHGDLHPGNLLLSEGPEAGLTLSGVIDWDRACAGDPLLDWALAVQMPVPTLARVIEGYGRDRAEELLYAEARLGVYARARCLMRLAVAGQPALGASDGRPRALALELARERAEEMVVEGAARRRLEAALASAQGPVAAWGRPSGSRILRRRALEILRWSERLGQPGARGLVAALGAVRCAERVEGLPAAEPWLLLGEAALPRVPATTTPLPSEAVDPGPWRASLVARVLAPLRGLTAPGPCLSLGLLALGLDALDALGGAASPSTLRGLETLLQGLLSRERLARAGAEAPPGERLLHAWLGAWALGRLGLSPDQAGELRGALSRQGASAWEALAAAPGEPEALDATALLQDPAAILGSRREPLIPVLLCALAEGVSPPGVQAPPRAVLRALRLLGEAQAAG